MKIQQLTLIAAFSALSVAAGVTHGFNFRPSTPAMAQNPCAANPCAANPCAANPCAADPCAAKAANPCAANPCAAKAANPCAANPCAAKTANPCAANPCAAKTANPCAANPCAANPCAANPCAANPCAAAAEPETADVQAVAQANAEYQLQVIQEGGRNIVPLTQAACQFLEAEGTDMDFRTFSAADCRRINSETSGTRTAQPLTIPAGEYTFRVSNQDVPYEVGFYLRGAGLGGLTLPNVSGGGLFLGETKDYTISLKPGEYVYSCPLNPTLRYPLTVTAS